MQTARLVCSCTMSAPMTKTMQQSDIIVVSALTASLRRTCASRCDWATWLTGLGNGSKEAQILQHRALVHQDELYATVCQVTIRCQAQCALITAAGGHNGHDAFKFPFRMLPAPLQHQHSRMKLCLANSRKFAKAQKYNSKWGFMQYLTISKTMHSYMQCIKVTYEMSFPCWLLHLTGRDSVCLEMNVRLACSFS